MIQLVRFKAFIAGGIRRHTTRGPPPFRQTLDRLPQQGNLVVIVDSQSARYPWELLENRWASGERPPSVAAGFVRQFRTAEFRQRPAQSLANTALVIGNPDLQDSPDFCDLPGARDEAQLVAEQLAAEGYAVSDCIDQSAPPILEALHKDSWRILHLAGHGVHEFPVAGGKPVSGMVIGPTSFLTPGDIAQMRFVPDLVFINCCLHSTEIASSLMVPELVWTLATAKDDER